MLSETKDNKSVLLEVKGNSIKPSITRGYLDWEVVYKGRKSLEKFPTAQIINEIFKVLDSEISIPSISLNKTQGELKEKEGKWTYSASVLSTEKKTGITKPHGIANDRIFSAIKTILEELENANSGKIRKDDFVFRAYKYEVKKNKKDRTKEIAEKQLEKNSSLVEVEQFSKNIIFYGPPGTGKTRKAKILAYKILMKNNDKEGAEKTDDEILDEVKKIIQGNSNDKSLKGRIQLVQFHPSYSYNDFMESIEFSGEGCEYKNKIFKEFAEKARQASEEAKKYKIGAPAYVLIIDEINRANVSNVLGELLYGLEYREKEFSTAIKGEKFSVPENLYIIGTMNTADRSLQNLDYAVRRRFSFEKVSAEEPLPEKGDIPNGDCYRISGNKWFCKKLFDTVRSHVEESVARGISAEDILPGISYFLVEGQEKAEIQEHLEYKIRYELIPLLKEYVKDGMFTTRKKIYEDKSLIDLLRGNKYEEILVEVIKGIVYEYSY